MNYHQKLEQKFEKFYQEHWPLPKPQNQPTESEIKKLNRLVWYCNNCNKAIPELQKYNACGKTVEYEPDELLCSQFYQKGNKNYRVYPCGHAFIDINLLGMIFDYINSFTFIGKKPVPKEIFQKMATECPMCHGKPDEEDKLYMYKSFNAYATGTVILRNTLPESYIQYLIPLFQEGDVIDTDGYRGMGLKVHNGTEFEEVPREEYYPIWPLHYLKKFGYRKMLLNLTWNDYVEYDELLFENGLSLNRWNNHFYKTDNFDDDLEKMTKEQTEEYVKKDGEDGIKLKINGGWVDMTEKDKDKNGFYLLPYPFDSVEQATAYWRSGLPLKALISDFDYLVFDPKEDSPYLTDLNGENKVDLCVEA